MSDSVIAASLTLDAGQATESVKSFKAQLRESQQELLNTSEKFGATSKEAANAAKKVAELRDRMGDANTLVDAFNPDAKFKGFGNVVQAVAGGFSALTGTMALFGVEGENVEKALLKVQAAMAISQGINSILEGADAFKAFGTQIKNTAGIQKIFTASTVAATAVTQGLGLATNTASTGFKLLRGAIIATGIGALIVAIGYLINNFDTVKKVIEKVVGPLKNITDFFGKLVNTVTDFVGATSAAERALDRLGKATQRRNEDLQNQIKILTAQGGKEKEIAEIRKNIIDNDIRLLSNKKRVEKELSEEDKKRMRDLQNEKNVISIEEQNRLKKLAEDAEKKRLEDQKKDAEAAKQAREKATRDREEKKKDLEEKLKQEKEYQAEVQKMIEASTIAINQIDSEKAQKEKDQFASRITNLQNSFQNEASVYNELRYLQMDEIAQQEQDELMRLGEWYKQRFELVKGNAAAEAALLQEYENIKGKIEKDSLDQRLSITGNLLGKMSDLFGKHTAAGKVTAIAEATINTYLAATKALTGIPKGNPFGAALAIAQAGVIIATGLKNIKEIVKVKVPGGGGGSAPSVGSEAAAPLRPQVTQTSTILPQEQINQMGNIAAGGVNRSVRAHVVESDSQAAAARAQRLRSGGKLGG